MLVCIIEFGVREGSEEQRASLLAGLMKVIVEMDGFISKETFSSRDNPGKLITLSYWRDEASLAAWVADRQHVKAVSIGKRSVFSHYNIEISEVSRTIKWEAPAEQN